jgi:hypothetical protein
MATTHRTQHGSRRARKGFTLSELLLGLTLTVLVFASAVPFFKVQTRTVTADMGRADALLTARFAQNTLDRELRNIGIGVEPMNAALGIPRNQPKIVQAADFAVTFNSNLVTTDTGDVAAVHYDPNVSISLTDAMVAGAVTLPLSSTSYPDHTYRKSNGSLSGAETISLWASLDSSTTTIPNDMVLFRRVNDGPIVVVTRGIELPTGQPLFRYTRVDTLGAQVSIPSSSLPMLWTDPRSDSIRTVEITVRSVYHDWNLAGDTTSYRRLVQSKTRLMNMGLVARRTCGDVPLDPGSVTAVYSNLGTPKVTVTWTPSIDENTGEKDVERYVIYRDTLLTGFTDPMDLVGKGVVQYEDFALPAPGTTVKYGVAAQDCSPSEGSIVPAAILTIP